MYRIDTAGNVPALPVPAALGAPGYFNPVPGGGAGTVVSADWLNAVQEELANIVAAGGLALDKTNAHQVLAALQVIFGAPAGQGQLQLVSNVALVFAPFGGNLIKVNGKTYPIPAAGMPIANVGVEVAGVANSNLAASTDYLVYAKDNGAGTLVPSFWPVAQGHMADTTAGNVGVEVRSAAGVPDSTRTLIGMVGTDAASHFADADGNRLVLSWFNRKRKPTRTNTLSNPATASLTPIELTTLMRSNFLLWAGDSVDFHVTAIANSGATNSEPITCIGFDGIVPDMAQVSAQAYQAGASGPIALSGVKEGLAEGRHYATVLGLVNATYPYSSSWGSLHQSILLVG